MIKILYEPILTGPEGVLKPEGDADWPYVPFQELHPRCHSSEPVVFQPRALEEYLELQQKLMYEKEHVGSEFDFYELTNHWALGLNFCNPLEKRLSEVQLMIDRTLRVKEPSRCILSGYTVGQLLQHTPLDKLDVVLYYANDGEKNELEINTDYQLEFGSDNYQYVRIGGGVGSFRVYRQLFKSITSAVLYMNLKVFASNGKVYCTADAIQSGWVHRLPYKFEIPVELHNQPKLPLKLFKKNVSYVKLFRRDYNMKTHSEKVLNYRWKRCYCCPNYVYKVGYIGERVVDYQDNSDICCLCYRQ